MSTFEFIIGIATILSGLVTFYMKTKIDNKKNIKEIKETIDTNQNNQINVIKSEITDIKKTINDIIPVVRKATFSDEICLRLKNKSADIIRLNPDIQSNSNMITLLLTGRDLIVQFAADIYFNKNKDDKYLSFEMSTIFDKLKMNCNTYFTEMRKVNDNEIMNYGMYLRQHTKINILQNVMITRLIENHKTENEYIEMFSRFIEDVYLQGIYAYRKFTTFEIIK